MNDVSKFEKLIPLFFNIIKRGENHGKLLSLIHQKKKKNEIQGSFNMKALFQILFNNSNTEMKTMLLKFWSKNNPVPLIFQNLECQFITQEEHLFSLNQYLFYIWQDSFPIINLSFSSKRRQIGKTQLINQIFFQMEKFETCDSFEINQDTADIVFDYSFTGSRHFTVADIHGRLPISILQILLPLFRLWIIQFDSETELRENFHYLQNFQSIIKDANPQICFLIRNSQKNLQAQYCDLINEIKNKKIQLHFIQDLTSTVIDKQILLNEMEEVAKFFRNLIKEKYFSKNFICQSHFIEILKQFKNVQSEPFIEEIQYQSSLIQNLQNELNYLIDKPEGFFSQEAFPIRSIESKIKAKNEEEMHERMKSDQNPLKLEELRKEIEILEKQMDQQHQTKLMQLFCNIFNFENYYILYIWVTEIIRKFNEEKMYELQNETQELNDQIIQKKRERANFKNKNEDQFTEQIQQTLKEKINSLKELLKESVNKIKLRNIGIEIFWRELIQQKEQHPQVISQLNPAEKVFQMIMKGEPFEFLDGDQFKINSQFLKQLTRKFEYKGEERILVLSVLGPQSSGKSTILNKIFGCHFWTSVGRCTKGIYLQLLKIHNKQYFNDLFDYIVLLDTEGLQSPNQQNQDFDKQIALFILAVSDILLINVKGDINQQFKNLVEMCIYTLGQLKSNFQSLKQLCWCFNQNTDVQIRLLYLQKWDPVSSQKEQKIRKILRHFSILSVNNIGPFFDQIQEIATHLNTEYNKTDSEDPKIDYNEILDIKKQNIKILGFSSYERSWKNSQFYNNDGQKNEWRQLISNDTFSEEAYHYGIEIIRGFANKFAQQCDQCEFSPLTSFNYSQSTNYFFDLPSKKNLKKNLKRQMFYNIQKKKNILNTRNWIDIQRLPDLLEFSELIQHQQNQFMKIKFEEIYEKLDFQFVQRIQNEIHDQVQQSEIQKLEIFNEIQVKMEQEITQKMEIIKKRAEEDLQQIRLHNKISKKISVKYVKQLEQRIGSLLTEGKITIYDQIKTYERQYQEKQGFAQIDKFVNDLLNNQKELIKFQEQPFLIKSEFQKLWYRYSQDAPFFVQMINLTLQYKGHQKAQTASQNKKNPFFQILGSCLGPRMFSHFERALQVADQN